MGRHLLIEVWSGPDAGLAYALTAGASAVVGRMAPSDAVLPSDRSVSRRHFSITFDGLIARIEDLGSSHGTTVNDRPVDAATILHGDRITAGETTLRVRLVDAAPAHATVIGLMPAASAHPAAAPIANDASRTVYEADTTPAPEPCSASTAHDRVLQALRAEPSHLFAILDSARDPMVYLRIHECPERKESLYEDAAPDLAFVAPYLVSLPKSSPFLDLLVREAWGQSWGVFLTSDRPFEEVRKHLRRFLKVEIEGGPNVLFRYYDPRVLRTFLPTCDAGQASELFRDVRSFLCEGAEDRLERFRPGPAGAVVDPLGLVPEGGLAAR